MEGWRLITSGALLVAAFGIFYLRISPPESVGNAYPRNLIIGVLSARDHFLQRDAVRQTWGSEISSLPGTELFFIVGEHDCPIHPDDRLSPYSCERWKIHIDDVEDPSSKRFVTKLPNVETRKEMSFECNTGIGFKILHPIILEGFSVSADLLLRVGNITVVLQDAEEVLESMEVSKNYCSDADKHRGYCDVSLPYPLLLPKHFEGELQLKDVEISEVELCGKDVYSLQPRKKWLCDWTNSSVIRFSYVRSRNNVLVKWTEQSCPLLSASFSVAERNLLKNHVENEPSRYNDWKNHLDFILRKITIEQVVNGDLMVVPNMDVYSRLPQKVMAFFKKSDLDFDFNFLMKVDDDTLVNVSSLKILINSEAYDYPKMWSRLQHHRAVPFFGKWADLNYPSLTYPSFPAGAGYLMTGPLVKSLVVVGPYLAAHGGEDVSMGIWISSAKGDATFVDVPCWLPNSECQDTVLVSQLSPIDMMEIWKKFPS